MSPYPNTHSHLDTDERSRRGSSSTSVSGTKTQPSAFSKQSSRFREDKVKSCPTSGSPGASVTNDSIHRLTHHQVTPLHSIHPSPTICFCGFLRSEPLTGRQASVQLVVSRTGASKTDGHMHPRHRMRHSSSSVTPPLSIQTAGGVGVK